MKWIIRLFIILIAAIGVAVGALFFLPDEKIAKIAADQIKKATGRQVEITGNTKISFYPVLGISTGKVTIANAEWSKSGPMMTAQSLKVGVDPVAMIKGEIHITGLEVITPEVLLERTVDGRVNWDVDAEGAAPSEQTEGGEPAQSQALALTLDRALITGATIRYVDHGTGERFAMEKSDLDLRWPDFNGEANFDAVLRPAGQAIEISGRLDRVGDFLSGDTTDMSAVIRAPGGTVKFSGSGGVQPQLSGQLSVAFKDTARFMGALGIAGVDIPTGLGQAIAVDGDLSVSQDLRVSVRGASMALDHNQMTGAADVWLGGAKPKVNVQLRAGKLDLSKLASGNSSGSGSGNAAQVGWSKDPIDASGLGLLDGDIALEADALDLGTFNFNKTRINVVIDQSRAVASLTELNGYGGVVSGQFVANNRGGLSVAGDIKANGIDLKAVLTDAAGITRFTADGNANLKFLGAGQTVDVIMKSLSGSGSVKTGKGHISGFDLDKLMRTGNGTGGTTIFDEMSASFTIKGGNLHNDDLTMALPLASATGKGRIGLGAQDINYLFTPVLLEGDNGGGIAIPVRIKGPWSGPRIVPDLESAIDLNLKKEKKKLKKKAKEEISKAVEQNLGVTVEDGQSIEDAVKKKVKKKVSKKLLKLFE